MSWQQLVQPTLPGVGRVGWCLQYVRQRYGINYLYDPAWQGWANAKYRHEDRSFPPVAVPVWFKYKLPDSSPGHVVIRTADGKFYSSPYSSSQKYYVFSSIEEIEKTLKAGFVGWTEDVNGVRVVKYNEETSNMSDKVTTVELPDMVRGYLMREPNKDDNVHLGKTWQQAQFDFIHSPQRGEVQKKWDSIPGLVAQVAKLQKENDELKKGFAQVPVYVKVADLSNLNKES